MLFWIRTYLFLAPIDYFSLFSFWPNFCNKSGHISAQLSRNLIADISCSLPWKADFALLVNALVAIGMIFMLFVWFDGFGGFSACCVLGSLPFRIDRVCSWCIFYLNVSSSTWKFSLWAGLSLSLQSFGWRIPQRFNLSCHLHYDILFSSPFELSLLVFPASRSAWWLPSWPRLFRSDSSRVSPSTGASHYLWQTGVSLSAGVQSAHFLTLVLPQSRSWVRSRSRLQPSPLRARAPLFPSTSKELQTITVLNDIVIIIYQQLILFQPVRYGWLMIIVPLKLGHLNRDECRLVAVFAVCCRHHAENLKHQNASSPLQPKKWKWKKVGWIFRTKNE